MRLVCPNCGAQYEVPAEVIPESGRDVQCSNCGDTWFQNHPDHDTGLAEELGETLTDPVQDAPPDADQADDHAEWQEDETPGEAGEDAPDEADTPPVTQPRKRGLDPSVTDVLREEAAREEEARKRESATLEEQPDLGLQQPSGEADRRQREARERMAKMRGTDPEPEPAASAGTASPRRDVLPDVDEINSTLRKDSERRKTATQAAEERDARTKPGGFRRGFLYVLLIAVVLLLLYIFAPQISETVPALAPYMESYVLAVNEGRIWLDEQIRALMSSLDGMASDAPAEPPADE
ncbi:hypothetical protein DZK27_03010 [Rhodobacteraceae bacterium 63075]|nr:hypothetical protein DZK27_03010 [Rhodobacteraceae bacterium 63075]